MHKGMSESHQFSTQLSYVGTMYLMLMKASSPPFASKSSSVSCGGLSKKTTADTAREAIEPVSGRPGSRVENGQQLPVVGNQGFPDHIPGDHELLQDLEDDDDDSGVSGVESLVSTSDKTRLHVKTDRLEGDDELRNDRQNL
eukprot:768518-Hanusia_phi.AAC.10